MLTVDKIARDIDRIWATGIGNTKMIIEEAFDTIKAAVDEGGSVYIHGFGTFKQKHIKREGKTPQGEPYSVDKWVVGFKPTKGI